MPNTLQFGLVCVFAAAYFFVSRQAPEPSIAAQCMEWYTATMANFGTWTAGWQLYAAIAALCVERITYSVVWCYPNHFMRFCKSSAYLTRQGTPVDVVVQTFWVHKILQIGAFAGYGFWANGFSWPLCVTDPSKVTLFQWVFGALLILLDQFLNGSIYQAIGKNGVYYGARLGQTVPWCEGYPFNVVAHPQYMGVMMSIYGMTILTASPVAVANGWFGLTFIQGILYFYMGIVENHAPQLD